MAKALSQKAVKELCEEWSTLQVQITKAEEARQRALDPIIERHNEELKPVLAKHDPKISRLQSRIDEIGFQVRKWMVERDGDTSLSGETWEAGISRGETLGDRVVDVKKFIDLSKKFGDAIYECMTVVLRKAEPLIGKKSLDEISTRPKKPTASFWLRRK